MAFFWLHVSLHIANAVISYFRRGSLLESQRFTKCKPRPKVESPSSTSVHIPRAWPVALFTFEAKEVRFRRLGKPEIDPIWWFRRRFAGFEVATPQVFANLFGHDECWQVPRLELETKPHPPPSILCSQGKLARKGKQEEPIPMVDPCFLVSKLQATGQILPKVETPD